MKKKLFIVTLSGQCTLYSSFKGYVVATNATDAYLAVKKHYDNEDIGYPRDRELVSVSVVASESDFSNLLVA